MIRGPPTEVSRYLCLQRNGRMAMEAMQDKHVGSRSFGTEHQSPFRGFGFLRIGQQEKCT